MLQQKITIVATLRSGDHLIYHAHLTHPNDVWPAMLANMLNVLDVVSVNEVTKFVVAVGADMGTHIFMARRHVGTTRPTGRRGVFFKQLIDGMWHELNHVCVYHTHRPVARDHKWLCANCILENRGD